MSHIYIYASVSLHGAPLHSDTHVNESFDIHRNHVMCEGVMSRVNVPCHICMGHVTYEWIKSHMNESYHADVSAWCSVSHVWITHVTHELVMSHTYMHECHEWCSDCLCMVLRECLCTCHTWISYSCHTWISSVTHIYAWVSLHDAPLHPDTHMNASFHI